MYDTSLITKALPGLDAWVRALEGRDIPILESTAATLDDLRANEDAVDAHVLAPLLSEDPLATLKLLRHVAKIRAGRGLGDIETVTEALVMLGIPPFFRAFPNGQPTVDIQDTDNTAPIEGLIAVVTRSHRAARLAMCFAAHRQDQDAELVAQAAMLHDFAELLVWLHAPSLARETTNRLHGQPGLRSAVAQREVLGVVLAELQHALMLRWHLPELLVLITDDHHSALAKVRNVQLAIRIARHSALGWENAALPDDFKELADLLQLSVDHAVLLVRDTDNYTG